MNYRNGARRAELERNQDVIEEQSCADLRCDVTEVQEPKSSFAGRKLRLQSRIVSMYSGAEGGFERACY